VVAAVSGGAAWGYDPIAELREILAAHPRVTYLPPRESQSGEHEAVWEQPGAPGHEGAVVRVHHPDPRDLAHELRSLLGPGAPS
jgi:hypothetical protein